MVCCLSDVRMRVLLLLMPFFFIQYKARLLVKAYKVGVCAHVCVCVINGGGFRNIEDNSEGPFTLKHDKSSLMGE